MGKRVRFLEVDFPSIFVLQTEGLDSTGRYYAPNGTYPHEEMKTLCRRGYSVPMCSG